MIDHREAYSELTRSMNSSRCSHPAIAIQVCQTYVDWQSRSYGYFVTCDACHQTGKTCSDPDSAKYSFYQDEFIRTLGSVFKNPEKLVKTEPEVDYVDIYRQVGENYVLQTQYLTFEEIARKYPMAILPNPTPYWIIVSDEGHAAIPAKHLTKEAADAEAKRLTAAKPGATFTVFEAKYSLKTPKAEAVKTTYEPKATHFYDPYPWVYPIGR